MSSAENHQGYDLARNSSKVLAPPGGKSSISFGGYSEEPAPVRRPVAERAAAAPQAAAPQAAAPAAAPQAPAAAQPAMPARPPASRGIHDHNNIFGAPAASKPAAEKPEVPAGQRKVEVPIMEKPHQVSDCQVSRNKSSVFAAPEQAPRRTITKLHAPPGGASSITFG